MLVNLKPIGDDLQSLFKEITDWPELKFTPEIKELLKKISFIKKVNDTSIYATTSRDGSLHTIFVSQYVLYALLAKEFSTNFYKYIKVLDGIKQQGLTNSEIHSLIVARDMNSQHLGQLDVLEKKLFYQVFNVEDLWDAKQILSSTNGRLSMRSGSDFFGSVLLKLVNIPDTSNGIFGEFIYGLCEHRDVYDALEKAYLKYLPILYKSRNRGAFAASILRFCFQYDGLSSLWDLLRPSTSSENITIELGDNRLSGIFKKSASLLSPEVLISGVKPRYFDDPLFKIDNFYYYLSTEWTSGKDQRLDLVNLKTIIEIKYPFLFVDLSKLDVFELRPSGAAAPSSLIRKAGGSNVIYFGPPGTGKSYRAKKSVEGSKIITTLFHPEYSYSDFLGSYRPVIGHDKLAPQIDGYDFQPIPRPVNYFEFVPGPLIVALSVAFSNPNDSVCLMIDELNRGECAAIFGDIFQLLDRDFEGTSEYGVDLKPEIINFFSKKGIQYDIKNNGKLYFPSNFSIIATINTSDQSLYPIDAAFKRRWDWVSCPINFNELKVNYQSRITMFDGSVTWFWEDLLTTINQLISKNHMEDKQLGPWFIKPNVNGEIAYETFLNKCLFYLWHDVYKDDQFSDDSPFELSEDINSFSSLQEKMRAGGLVAGFKADFLSTVSNRQPSAS
jgi:hypothetical protein